MAFGIHHRPVATKLFTSDNFASATNTIDLELEGNAASFTLNPEKGCA